MGWRVTVALLGAVTIATAVLWTDLRRMDPGSQEWSVLGDERGEAPGKKVKYLLGFDPASITAVRLTRDGVAVQVTRTGGQWVGPIEPRLIDDFLKSLQEMAEIAPLEVPAEERKDYGLDPPHSVIELERAGADPIVVLLGQHNPAATGVYAQLGADGRVVLTGAAMLWEFDKAFKGADQTGTPVAAAAADGSS